MPSIGDRILELRRQGVPEATINQQLGDLIRPRFDQGISPDRQAAAASFYKSQGVPDAVIAAHYQPAASSSFTVTQPQAAAVAPPQPPAPEIPPPKTDLQKLVSLPATFGREFTGEFVPGLAAAIGGTAVGGAGLGASVLRSALNSAPELKDLGGIVGASARGADAMLPQATISDKAKEISEAAPQVFSKAGYDTMVKPQLEDIKGIVSHPIESFLDRPLDTILNASMIFDLGGSALSGGMKAAKIGLDVAGKAGLEGAAGGAEILKGALSIERAPIHIAGMGDIPQEYSANPLAKVAQMGLEKVAPTIRPFTDKIVDAAMVPAQKWLGGSPVPDELATPKLLATQAAQKIYNDSQAVMWASKRVEFDAIAQMIDKLSPEQVNAFNAVAQGKATYIKAGLGKDVSEAAAKLQGFLNQDQEAGEALNAYTGRMSAEQLFYGMTQQKVDQVAYHELVRVMRDTAGDSPEEITNTYQLAANGRGPERVQAQATIDKWTKQAKAAYAQNATYSLRNALEIGGSEPITNIKVKPYKSDILTGADGKPLKGFQVNADQGAISMVPTKGGEYMIDGVSLTKPGADTGKRFGQQLYLHAIRTAEDKGASSILSLGPSPEAINAQDALARKGLISIEELHPTPGTARTIKLAPSKYSDEELAGMVRYVQPDPVYFPHISQSDKLFQRMSFTSQLKAQTPDFLKGRTGALRDYIVDPLQALQIHESQKLRYIVAQSVINDIHARFSIPLEVGEDALRAGETIPGTAIKATEDYVPFQPDDFVKRNGLYLEQQRRVVERIQQGQNLTQAMYETMAESSGKLGASAGAAEVETPQLHQIPKSIHDTMLAQIRPFSTNPDVKLLYDMATGAIDKSSYFFKRAVLNLTPRWLLKHTMGKVFLSMMDDVGPDSFRLATDPKWQGIIPSQLIQGTVGQEASGAIDRVAMASDKYAPAAIDSASPTFGAQAAKAGKAIMAGPQNAVDKIETYFRTAAYIDAAKAAVAKQKMLAIAGPAEYLRAVLDRFMGVGEFSNPNMLEAIQRLQQQSPELADKILQQTKTAMFNYDTMTPIEKMVLRRAFPFWGWFRNVSRFALAMPATYPVKSGILLGLSKIGNDVNDMEWRNQLGEPAPAPSKGDWEEKHPTLAKLSPFQRAQVPIAKTATDQGDRAQTVDFSAATLLDSLKSVGLHPILKTIAERLFLGRNLDTMEPFTAPDIIHSGGRFYTLTTNSKGEPIARETEAPLPPIAQHLLYQLPQVKAAEAIANVVRNGSNTTQYDLRQPWENAPRPDKRGRVKTQAPASERVLQWLGAPERSVDLQQVEMVPKFRAKDTVQLMRQRAMNQAALEQK